MCVIVCLNPGGGGGVGGGGEYSPHSGELGHLVPRVVDILLHCILGVCPFLLQLVLVGHVDLQTDQGQ